MDTNNSSSVEEVCISWLKDQVSKAFDIPKPKIASFFQEQHVYITDFLMKQSSNSSLIFYSSSANEGKYQQPRHSPTENNLSNKDIILHITNHHIPDDISDYFSMYFIKNVSGKIEIKPNEEIDLALANIFDFGVISDPLLNTLEQVIQQVYVPAIFPNAAVTVDDEKEDVKAERSTRISSPRPSTIALSQAQGAQKIEIKDNTTAFHNDFQGTLQKFAGQISHAIQQITGDVHLPIPNVVIDNPETAAQDFELVSTLRGALEEWVTIIAKQIELETKKSSPGPGEGPMAEIRFWRNRNAALSGLYEQLNLPHVKKMIYVLELQKGTELLPVFEEQYQELIKYYIEAKDNVRFLQTLQRHFDKILSGNLDKIKETIPSMMNALRMVWIISRHYSSIDRMQNLMELVANELADKVAREINIRSIFRRRADSAMTMISKAKTVLELWYSSYLKIRSIIEANEERRWDFSWKKLFEHTDYMARICTDLHEVAETLDQFHKFLGPALKKVTGDSQGIDEVRKYVQTLITPLENVPFNVFNKRYNNTWMNMMKQFREKVQEIEGRTEQFINTSFQKLRSAEGAFDLLQDFKKIDCRRSILFQMMSKVTEILNRYNEELNEIHQLFVARKDNPPVSPNQPPVAGAIAWARSLFERIKKPILRFQTMEDLLQSEKGISIVKRYEGVAMEMWNYEVELYEHWKDKVPVIVKEGLHQSVLSVIEDEVIKTEIDEKNIEAKGAAAPGPISGSVSPIKGGSYRPISSHHGSSLRSSRLGGIAPSLPSRVQTAGASNAPTRVFHRRKFAVHFSPMLLEVIRETKYLDRMGFSIPESAYTVALQENTFYKYGEDLNAMLRRYEEVLDMLSPEEMQLLRYRIADLQRVLEPGITPLNWLSLGIQDFIGKCNDGINSFQGIIHKIQKKCGIIEKAVQSIKNAHLIDLDIFLDNNDTHRIADLVDRIERHRSEVLESLLRKYSSIGPLLEQLEPTVVNEEDDYQNTSTDRKKILGDSLVMREYYKYWEKRIFHALTRMVVRGVKEFEVLLKSCSHHRRSSHGEYLPPRVPLVRMSAEMVGDNLTVSPAIGELQRIILKLPRTIAESSKNFVRWMDGTCRECAPQRLADDDEWTPNFWNDIKLHPYTVAVFSSVNEIVLRVFKKVDGFIESWHAYDERPYFLWNTKKMGTIDQDKSIGLVGFDRYMSRYSRLSRNIRSSIPPARNIDFMHIECLPVILAIEKQSREWVSSYGNQLCEQSTKKFHDVQSNIQQLTDKLRQSPTQLDSLKFVLRTICEIHNKSLQMEVDILDVVERFRTLKQYNVDWKLSSEESNQVLDLEHTWAALLLEANKMNESLSLIKVHFTEQTQLEIEEFTTQVLDLKQDFDLKGPGSDGVDLDTGLRLMDQYTQFINDLLKRENELSDQEQLFNLTPTRYQELAAIQSEMNQLNQIYAIYLSYKQTVKYFSLIIWSELDVNVLNRGIEDIEYQVRSLPAKLRNLPTCRNVKSKIEQFKETIPIISNLKNESCRPRHWEKLMETTGVHFDMDPSTFTLGKLFAMQLSRFADQIAEITNSSQQEAKIERALQALNNTWNLKIFPMAQYQVADGSFIPILADCSEIFMELEDNVVRLTTMKNSIHAAHFMKEIDIWGNDMHNIQECIKYWMLVQMKWMYLEGIFMRSDDIRSQLQEATKRFEGINEQFKRIMAITAKNPNVLVACRIESRLRDLKDILQGLENSQRKLTSHLKKKRNIFPRFFFISDNELLSILGSRDPTSVQIHMLKLFDNCKELIFARENRLVTGMISSEGESFSFKPHVNVDNVVENWMQDVERLMVETLHQITKVGVFNYANSNRIDWINNCLGMVSIVGTQIWWTWEVEDAFRLVRSGNKHAMKQLAKQLSGQLAELVDAIRKGDLDDLMRKKLNTLIIIDVHQRDIVDRFVRDSVLDDREFDYESQLRFYWDKEKDDIVIRQCTGVFKYSYEYIGLKDRLVITPLTDRCYMTLTQALTFFMGGSPAGPAGTGKTETVKDLAKAMANICIVTNCGESLDFEAMGSLFSGLVQTGAWGCFDEFNRIDPEVLSVVSMQLKTIQDSLARLGRGWGVEGSFEFLGQEVKLKPRCGFFITMNVGYVGRTELPDNLKALFRPVVMVVPDMLQICEIVLLSEGFGEARLLAKKMCVLYRLAERQLSRQHHYSFGLRALKSVLVMAGALKRDSTYDESRVLMRALRDMNLPKFVFEDVALFLGLINDLFPNLECPRVVNKQLKDAIIQEYDAQGFKHSNEQCFNTQVDKTIQLFETMLTRHTTMVVGPTGGGKTTLIRTLAAAQGTAFHLTTKLFVLNPKAQSVAELYGTQDPVTREWKEGLLSKLFDELNRPLKPNQKEYRYLVFDGDVDAKWIENMNSVMDDNKLLTLADSRRIRLQDHVKLLIEVGDLSHASPATVSRCGMVYVDPKNLGFRPYYDKWIKQRHELTQSQIEYETLTSLFDKYMVPCLAFVADGMLNGQPMDAEHLSTIIPFNKLNMVVQFCSLYSAFMKDHMKLSDDAEVVESVYAFCLIWSVGGVLVANSASDDRERFDTFVKTISHVQCINNAIKGQLPQKSIFENTFDLETQKWVPWDDYVKDYQPPIPFNYYKILVPTVDTVKYSFLLDMMVETRRPVLFVGESGTAKTVIIQNYLDNLDFSRYSSFNINFSSRTSSMDVQTTLLHNLDQRTGHIYTPKHPGKKLIVFIDDLNMPQLDTYGTQQPIAWLKLLLERGYCYDRAEDLDLCTVRDVLYCAAMAPPGGGRYPVDARFLSHFCVFNLTNPNNIAMKKIFSSILMTHVHDFEESVRDAAHRITPATLQLYQEISNRLPPTPSKFHYIFNLRDLSRLYEGLLLSTPEKFSTPEEFIRLWRNETLRIFHDRLINQQDRVLVKDVILGNIIAQNFPNEAPYALQDPLLFADFGASLSGISVVSSETTIPGSNPTTRPSSAVSRPVTSSGIPEISPESRIYEDLQDYSSVQLMFNDVLKLYNHDLLLQRQGHFPMNLVLFQDALDHLLRIHRIIRMPRGNAMLVGVGGSGKQSLTKLATYAAKYKLFEIQLTRNYSENDFKDDLRKLYALLGTVGGGSPVTFLFTDNHIKDASFLELINNMLTSGMVPALFQEDEKIQFCDSVRTEVQAQGIPDTRENCWNFWLNKCRDNLHIVLAMSPAGDNLRQRCRNFPGLVNNTIIDWFFSWPEQALRSVADSFLKNQDLPNEYRQSIIDHMVQTHLSVAGYSEQFELELRRSNFITPKHYLELIHYYVTHLKKYRTEMGTRFQRYSEGLQRLIDANDQVELKKKILAQKQIVVQQKAKVCSETINVISECQQEKESKQKLASEKNEQLIRDSEIIARDKHTAQEALKAARPMLEAGKRALDDISRDDISELSTMRQPPAAVVFVGQCVLELKPTGKENPAEGWLGVKRMMTDTNFLKRLKEFDVESRVSPSMARAIKKILSRKSADPKQELNEENLERISKAGLGMLRWVLAVLNYHQIYRDVLPTINKIHEMEIKTKENVAELAIIENEKEELTRDIEKLNGDYSQQNNELQILQHELQEMERHLDAATKLIDGLGSERKRWSREKAYLASRKDRLVGDCLLTSSFLSYIGPFTHSYRNKMVYDDWYLSIQEKKLPVSENFRVDELLTSEVQKTTWASEGLPMDDLSIQNAILTTNASRFPLCIDPQMQAYNWLCEKERRAKGDANLLIMTFNDKFMLHLELSIVHGNTFIFAGVEEELDPIIDPILEKAYKVSGNQKTITLGDKNIEWDDNFRLYMVSKLSNPKYSPEVASKTMIINYTVTMNGLEDQLLNHVIRHEQPKTQSQREELIQTIAKNNIALAQLEETILFELTQMEGDILDNVELIKVLEDAKENSKIVVQKQEDSRRISDDLAKFTDQYRPAAKRGAILFFSISSLSAISKMYEHSLNSFIGVFYNALSKSARDSSIIQRLNNVINLLTKMVYDYTCTGLFEKHKLMYAFNMTTMIKDGEGQLNKVELDFFLRGNAALEQISNMPLAPWISQQGWKDLNKLVEISKPFHNLIYELENNLAEFRAWYDLERPEEAKFPAQYTSLTPFQKLLLIRCFRSDRVYSAVKNYIISEMGTDYFVMPPVLEYERIYQQSSNISPVVFILSPGADPMSDMQVLAGKYVGHNKFKYLALGQGQASDAQEALETGALRGHWVVLQNCHLMPSWLKTLEKLIYSLHKPHPDFRLWLTTNPMSKDLGYSREFPIGILQCSFKVVTEPPDGLKMNMKQTYSKISEEKLNHSQHPAFRPLVYVLSFFHAVVQERRKYGKLGWNVPYDFNESDFNVSFELLAMYLNKALENKIDTLPWGSLRYLIGEAMYGGRVTDEWDRRILYCYMEEYMGDFLFDECQPYFFAKTPTYNYGVPESDHYIKYLDEIDKKIPLDSSPEVFGLHSNAEIDYHTNFSRSIWHDLINMQPQTAKTIAGISREEKILKTVSDIEFRVPQPFDMHVIHLKFQSIASNAGQATLSPTQIVLMQELERWNILVNEMKNSLEQVTKAFAGEIGMSYELDELATSLYNGYLPNIWRRLAPPTQKDLSSWMVHFQERYRQYDNWIQTGKDPTVLWLAGLSVPEAFLTALVQTTCRKKGWPLDKSTLYTTVSDYTSADQVEESLPDGCYIRGLYLEGAAWDQQKKILYKQDPKKLFVELPLLQVIPIESSKLKLQNTLKTPVYITQERQNRMGEGLVFSAELGTNIHPSHWVLQGTAIVLNTNE